MLHPYEKKLVCVKFYVIAVRLQVHDKKLMQLEKDICNNTAHTLRGDQNALFKNIFFHVFLHFQLQLSKLLN